MSATEALPTAWKAAVEFCPFCSADGCVRCGGTGDLMGHLLGEAYQRGREEALVQMREVYQVSRLAGRTVAELPVPADLKRSLGL
jgi:hypothetical protein